MPKITNDTFYPAVSVPALTDELIVLQSDVVKKETISQALSLAAETVTYNAADTTITLTTSDLNKVLAVNNALAVQVNLPSVAAANIGAWIEIHRMGAGSLTIDAADSDVINDSSAGGKIACTTAGQTYAVIRLRLVTATIWRMAAMPMGSWTTA